MAVATADTVSRLQRAISPDGHDDRHPAALDCGWTCQYLEHNLTRTAVNDFVGYYAFFDIR